jgi:hypothetical protein
MTRTAVLVVALVLSACALVDEVDPVVVCQEQADAAEPHRLVVGSFATTVTTVRGLMPGGEPEGWPELRGEGPAVLCYLDGPLPQGPPGGEPFDRAVIAVAGDDAQLIIAGYRDELEVRAP